MNTNTKSNRLQKELKPVPNNPRDNQLYIDKKEMNKEKKFNKDMMLFDKAEDILRKVVSKHEPGEPKRTQYLKVDKDKFAKDMEFWKKRNQQAAARERLNKKGAVPTKSGRRLFEEFCKEAYKNRTHQTKINDADLRNIYNAATQLEYDKWMWWIMNEYQSVI